MGLVFLELPGYEVWEKSTVAIASNIFSIAFSLLLFPLCAYYTIALKYSVVFFLLLFLLSLLEVSIDIPVSRFSCI